MTKLHVWLLFVDFDVFLSLTQNKYSPLHFYMYQIVHLAVRLNVYLSLKTLFFYDMSTRIYDFIGFYFELYCVLNGCKKVWC